MRKILLASALACALSPAATFEASAAAGNSMITRGTYQTYALRCQVVGRGQTNTIIVINNSVSRVPQGTKIELRVRNGFGGYLRQAKVHTRIAHTVILRGSGIRLAGVADARTCSATVKLSLVASLVR